MPLRSVRYPSRFGLLGCRGALAETDQLLSKETKRIKLLHRQRINLTWRSAIYWTADHNVSHHEHICHLSILEQQNLFFRAPIWFPSGQEVHLFHIVQVRCTARRIHDFPKQNKNHQQTCVDTAKFNRSDLTLNSAIRIVRVPAHATRKNNTMV